MPTSKGQRALRNWLFFSAFLVFSIVAVGGLTRLTRSGLSIVEWKPISGILPPLTEEHWQAEFDKYKQFPEYKQVNHQMDLDEFKYIYAWEYLHRLLGRLIGVVFAIPLLVFALRRELHGSLSWKLPLALLLGGLQGLLGWYMVKSGLVNMPRVSHYRLAAHLSLALFIMSYLFWIAIELKNLSLKPLAPSPSFAGWPNLPLWTRLFLALISIQIFYGALTAGLHAGHMYNTFPLMNGQLIPQGIGSMGLLRDFFESPVTVQFVHRCLGWLTFFSALGLGFVGWRGEGLGEKLRTNLKLIGGMASLQFTLGVLTLLYAVPVSLGSLHQIGACVLLLLSVYAVQLTRRKKVVREKARGNMFPVDQAQRI